MGEAGAGAARSSVAEVAPLEAVARGISARPGMRGSLTVTKEAEKELLGGLQGVFGLSPRRQMPARQLILSSGVGNRTPGIDARSRQVWPV